MYTMKKEDFKKNVPVLFFFANVYLKMALEPIKTTY